MTETLSLPVLGLDNEFPAEVAILHHVSSGKYCCYCHGSVHGLAAFSSEDLALGFARENDIFGMVTQTVSFDEAREIAKGRPLPVVALMLLDRIDDPAIHYVR
jgi:hypothetical protein